MVNIGESWRFGRFRSDACDRWYYRETRVEASRRPCSNWSDAERIFTESINLDDFQIWHRKIQILGASSGVIQPRIRPKLSRLAPSEVKSKRSVSELVNLMAWDTECEPVCKLAKLSPLRRDSVSRSSCGCVTERNCLPSNMSHVLARVRDVLIEFTVNTNLPFSTAKSFQLLEIWTNPTIREAAFRSLGE